MTSSSSSTLLSSFVPPLMKDEEPNWAELPSELTSSILVRLSVTEILEIAQKVCRRWRHVCKDPSMWRKIDMSTLGDQYDVSQDISFGSVTSMCRHAVDLSQGGLVDINLGDFVSTSLLTFIANRSSNLRSLGLSVHYRMTNKGLVKAIEKLPLLETLEVSYSFFKLDLKAVGQACPQLKTLKLNSLGFMPYRINCHADYYALAIAESMPELRHLQLLGNRLTNTGLNAILDSCPHLEHLDLRKCFNINLVGNLLKRCLERLKELRCPNDSTTDYPHEIIFAYYDFEDDLDYIFGGDDTEVAYDLAGVINYISD